MKYSICRKTYPSPDQCRAVTTEDFVAENLKDIFGLSRDQLTFTEDDKGKPFLSSHPQLYFNVSRTADSLFCTFSNGPIGLDVEEIRDFSADSISRFLSEDERTYCSDNIRTLEIWTKKEAISKYYGDGLNMNFSSFSSLQPSDDYVVETEIDDRFIISLCCSRSDEAL